MKIGSRVASFIVCAGLAFLGMTSTASAAEVWLEATIAFVYPQADGSLTLAFNEAAQTA
jgi:ABC-type sugar transport system substrate-binding protein